MSVALTLIPCQISARVYRWLAAFLIIALFVNVGATFTRDHGAPRVQQQSISGVGQASVAPDALRDTSPGAPQSRLRTSPRYPTTSAPQSQPTLISSMLAADPEVDYAVGALTAMPGTLLAANPAQGFTTRFGVDGVRIDPMRGGGWTMHAATLLAGDVSLPLAAVAPVTSGGRVEYRRGDLTEWYANDRRGLEQGFTLAAPPAGSNQFTLALAVDGALPVMAPDGTIRIGDEQYSGLTVTDATGAALPAHLTADGHEIGIAVDARDAAWPVTIDPFLTRQTLTAGGDAAQNDQFGTSVAVATLNGATTIVVGAPFKQVDPNSNTTGAVYVFTGSQGAYSVQTAAQPPSAFMPRWAACVHGFSVPKPEQ